MILIRNCRFIKALMEGYEEAFGDLVIEGKLIQKILPLNSQVTCDMEIDAKFATLLPGFFELHTHLNLSSQNVLELLHEEPEDAAFSGAAYAMELLRQGYTTVREVGTYGYAANAVKNAINRGIIQGPRLLVSGKIVTPTEMGNKTFGTMYHEADGPAEFRKACRQEFQKGADFIKIMGTGAFYNEGGVPGQTIITKEELDAAVEMTKLKDSYVAIHAHGTACIKLAIQCGVRTIEHGSFIDQEGINLLKDSKICFLVPTIGIDRLPYDAPESIPKHMWEKIDTLTKASHTCIKQAYEAGLHLGFGSDLDYENFKGRPGYEFMARKDMLDMDNIEILKQATIYSAEILGRESELGTIGVGKLADLVLIDGKPDENIDHMKNRPIWVMKEGVLYNNEG